MKHEVFFERGHNCIEFKCVCDSPTCVPDEGGSHGLSGMMIRFVVSDEAGAVQFLLGTPFVPSNSIPIMQNTKHSWMPCDLGYHSRVPRYEGQTVSSESCKFLGGDPCYYDGSSLYADDAYMTLANAGESALWEFLEQYYSCTFEDGSYPETGQYPKLTR